VFGRQPVVDDAPELPASWQWTGCGCCAPPVRATASGDSDKNPLQAQASATAAELRLLDFQPRSMLELPVTRIEQPRFPVIDVHTHLSWMAETRRGVSLGEAMVHFADPEAILALMDRKGIQAMINLTGGVGQGLLDTLARFVAPDTIAYVACDDEADEHYTELKTRREFILNVINQEEERFYQTYEFGLKLLTDLMDDLTAYKVRPASPQPPEKWETGTQSFESLAGVTAAVNYIASIGGETGNRQTQQADKRT